MSVLFGWGRTVGIDKRLDYRLARDIGLFTGRRSRSYCLNWYESFGVIGGIYD
jgi:hypothetical protein